ncbi:hypothetical protein [Streptomyces sp. NPDC015125]|uniref:hypothetical protein n=1 Tax=Streptomyces sp. NPDC015125 TaxID=3364938 RepID=UPI0036FE8D67
MFRIALRRALKQNEHIPRASAAARGIGFRQPLHAGHQDPGGDTPRAQRPDDQSAHRPQQPGPTRAPERQLAETDGQNAAAGAPYDQAHPAIATWTQSSAADRGTNELTLDDLKAMQQS